MRILTLCLLMVSAMALAAGHDAIGSWQSFGGNPGDESVVSVLESDQAHLVLDISVPGFWLYDYPAGGAVWDRVELPGHYSFSGVGLPELPSMTTRFALPFGTDAVVTVENVTSSVYGNLEILPRQTPEIDMAHEPFAFVMDENYYSSPRPYPAEITSLDNQGAWSGLNVASLVLNPFRFDPATGEMIVISSITVRIDFAGEAVVAAQPVNPEMVPAMHNSVVNWNDFESAAVPFDSGTRAGVEYVFICNSDNVDDVEELIETHHYLGLHSRVEILSSPATTGTIKTAITDNYETGVTRFALIVGDHSAMPSYSYSGTYGDFWYSLITGDNLPDLAVGRLTGTTAQIAAQIPKIMDGYMAYNWDDGNETGIIPSETVLAAHQEQYPNKYTLCCNQIAAYSYDLCNITFEKVYPPEGGTAADVTNAINAGVGTVGYRGHGDVTVWSWSPGWNATSINALTNTFMPPVFNIACYCGQYNTGTVCLSESWQWATGGSSGNLGATQPSYTDTNHEYMKQLYIALYDTGTYRIMEAINVATDYILANFGTYGLANARMYIWFGDPAMDIWTFDTAGEPGTLMISAPSTIPPGTQDVIITVTDDGTPVSGVAVTLTDGVENYGNGMTFYAEGTTNGSGQATINITAPSSGIVHVGAYLHDYEYDLADITIGVGIEEGSTGTPAAFALDRPMPNPVTVNASLGFSVPSSGRVELAVYDVSGRMVETLLDGTVEAGSHTVEWAPGTSISNGVYFLRLSTESGILTRQAMVIR